MKYAVLIPEVHYATIYVEAIDTEDAMDKAMDKYSITGVPDEPLEYSHTLDRDNWAVDEYVEVPMSPIAK
jgi:hypothetical protein